MQVREVWEAKKRIAPLVRKTPLLHSAFLTERAGRPVYLKLETVHEVGSFKIRGAANKLLSLSGEEKRKGVATYSTGNHGMAVAYAAGKAGIPAAVCVSDRVPAVKVESLRRFGARLEITGSSQDAAGERCYELERKEGMTVIPPFDDPYVIAGQGTIGLELLEDLPEITDVVIPLSGGGLLSGIALVLKSADPSIRVTGVSMERSAVMAESLKAGHPVELPESETLADSLLGGIGLDNRYTFSMVRQYMDEVVHVTENEIALSMALLADRHKLITEGAAAAGPAALLSSKIPQRAGALAVIISGQNVGLPVLQQVLKQQQ